MGHWVVVEKILDQKKEKEECIEKDIIETKFVMGQKETFDDRIDIYYDYETTFKSDNFAGAYSLSWFIDDHSGKPVVCKTLLDGENFAEMMFEDVSSRNHP